MPFYSVAGLYVVSENPLAGLAPVPETVDATAMVRIDDVPDHISGAIRVGPNWMMREAQLLICIPGLARFMLTDGRVIGIQPAPGRPAEDVLPFIPQMLGLLIQQGGRTVLRASAVVVDGQALLFCGDSGAGKSVFAAALANRRHSFLADDFCVIDPTADSVPVVRGDGFPPKLWADAIDALDMGDKAGDSIRCGIQKYHVRPAASMAGSAPLAGIYRLRHDRRASMPVVERLGGMEAVQLIRQCVYSPQLVGPSGRGAVFLQSAAAIARTAQIFNLTRENGFETLNRALRSVEEGWGE